MDDNKSMSDDQLELIREAAQLIYDKKGFNILALDVRSLSSVTDYFLIAEGNIDRHVRALARAIKENLHKKWDRLPLSIEGQSHCEWVVLDYGDLIIHLFTPELRAKYKIEKLWQEGKLVELLLCKEGSVRN